MDTVLLTALAGRIEKSLNLSTGIDFFQFSRILYFRSHKQANAPWFYPTSN